nr:putative late blight resistance protein homolog R1A-3 [Ipomoea batatas]
MADAAVQFLVENLLQLLRDNADLIFGIKAQAESLLGDLGDFKAFLKEAARRRSENEVIKELVKKIRIAVNKAEDAIDKFVVEAKLHRAKGMMTRYVDKPAHLVKVNTAAREIESIRKEVKEIRENNAYGLQALQVDNASKDAAERKASNHHFPRLKFLALRHCNKLEAVPFGLADIPSLQMMELYCTNKIAAESARKIQQHKQTKQEQHKQTKQEQEGTKSGGFKLSIYPPDH